SMRRIVYDNDFQPKDLSGKSIHRWQFPKGRWTGDSARTPKVFTHTAASPNESTEWMTYHHLLRASHVRQMPEQLRAPPGMVRAGSDPDTAQEALIGNMQGYNTSNGQEITGKHWVGDLMLDCEVQVSDTQGEFVLELSKGIDRFQAKFDLSN